MKKITLLSLCFVSLVAGAQTLKVDAGKKITGTTDMTMDMDMGMGGQMKVVTSTTNVLNITAVDDKTVTATNTVTRIKTTMEGMGQESDFDSDKKADMESETGKMIGKAVNKATTVVVNKITGKAEEKGGEKEETDGGNPLSGIMSDMAAGNGTGGAFFIIPAGKKTGDKWADSVSADGMKSTNNYELQSNDGSTANVIVKSVSSGTTTTEAQGMQMNMTMTTTKNEVVTLDPKTSVVKKRVTTADLNGSMDVMGQSLPISGKISSASTFE